MQSCALVKGHKVNAPDIWEQGQEASSQQGSFRSRMSAALGQWMPKRERRVGVCCLSMWFCGHKCPSAQGSAHLGLDLLGSVCEEDGGVGVAGTHFGLGPLQGGEEGGVQQGWFRIADPGGDISRHPEVRVLGERGAFEDGWKQHTSS